MWDPCCHLPTESGCLFILMEHVLTTPESHPSSFVVEPSYEVSRQEKIYIIPCQRVDLKTDEKTSRLTKWRSAKRRVDEIAWRQKSPPLPLCWIETNV
jgi:hypothetical protein